MTVSGETLQFKEHLERLSELALVLLLGGAVSSALWQGHDWWPAVFLLLVARPASVLLSLYGSAAPPRLRAMSAWFGVRGIGSIYYLMFAINQGLPAALAQQLVNITLLTILLSIVLHGATVAPLLERYQR
jgi:NhaP-type Na+/H+ or K+/H+ antiporter